MTGEQQDTLVTVVVVGTGYTAMLVAVFRYASARTPAGIVRRLMRNSRRVTVAVHPVNSVAWDPSAPLWQGGVYGSGRATYTLADGVVHLHFQPKSGPAIERAGPIPPALLPDTQETRRRRLIARAVTALYVLVGAATFAVVATFVHGNASIRLRYAAVVALGAVAASWLITHFVLLTRLRTPESKANGKKRHSLAAKHLVGWILGYLLAVAVLGVAWRLGNLDQPQPMSWSTAFLSAGLLVLVSGAALSASLHHHNYLHHPKDPPDSG